MQLYEKRSVITKVFEVWGAILPAIFWILLIFSFEEPMIGVMTLISALIHEVGHLCYLSLFSKGAQTLRAKENGLRIKTRESLSYGRERMTYFSGPLANIIVFLLCLIFCKVGGEYMLVFGIINLATALSNLMPIEGYDGYGIMRTLIEEKEENHSLLRLLDGASASLTFILCIFSIYLIDRYGGGYWPFAVFFVSMIKRFDKTLSK